jgi:hypothetical protein
MCMCIQVYTYTRACYCAFTRHVNSSKLRPEDDGLHGHTTVVYIYIYTYTRIAVREPLPNHTQAEACIAMQGHTYTHTCVCTNHAEACTS